MIFFQDTSFLKIENDVSLFLNEKESNLPLFLNLETELYYFKYLHYSLRKSLLTQSLYEKEELALMIFIRYILRSNLCFDVALTTPIQKKQSKLALMYGDYYLARAGAVFQNINRYSLLTPLLVNTLKRIAKSQWLQPETPVSLTYFFRFIALRYGSLFQFCSKAPFYLSKKKNLWNQNQVIESNALAIKCTLLKNASLQTLLLRNKKCFELMRLHKYSKDIRRI